MQVLGFIKRIKGNTPIIRLLCILTSPCRASHYNLNRDEFILRMLTFLRTLVSLPTVGEFPVHS
jgi:hypothetical protein